MKTVSIYSKVYQTVSGDYGSQYIVEGVKADHEALEIVQGQGYPVRRWYDVAAGDSATAAFWDYTLLRRVTN